MENNKVKSFTYFTLRVEGEDVQVPKDSLDCLKNELKIYEWPNHLTYSLNKVFKDNDIAAYVLLYIGMESNLMAWKMKGTVLNSKVNMKNVAQRINCNRELLGYIGKKYGNLLDKFWVGIADSDAIHKAKLNAQKKPVDAFPSLSKIKKAIEEKGFIVEEVGLYSDSGREISSHYDIIQKNGRKRTKVGSIHTDEKVFRIFRKDGFSITEFKLSCVNPAALELLGM